MLNIEKLLIQIEGRQTKGKPNRLTEQYRA